MTNDKLEAEHTPAAVRVRLASRPKPSYLRDWVYGGIDGAVTTFAIVAGVVGADLSSRIILIMGLANLFADGFSMAAGNYSGTKTEIDDYSRLQAIEREHIAQIPHGEREEVRQLLMRNGLSGEALEQATETVTSDPDRWVETMMREEYGLTGVLRSPIRAALSTFSAFVLCGAVPLLPFALGLPQGFTVSIVATGCVFGVIGALKSHWSLAPAWKSATETLLIGAAAALVAYVLGHLLKTIV
ncbi:MAG: VIT1/CCC1 transporter family protein [Hyphomicrobiaceae bacterium]